MVHCWTSPEADNGSTERRTDVHIVAGAGHSAGRVGEQSFDRLVTRWLFGDWTK